MEFRDMILLLHPVAAVVIVFPLIGIVLQRAWQTRQRRLETKAGAKSKIPPAVGLEHVQIGRWLAGSVVGIVLMALGNDVFGEIVDKKVWMHSPFKVMLISIFFGVAITSLFFLYRAQTQLWRWVFAAFTSIAIILIGCQDGIYRKTEQWYFSHYYYGMTAALLMIFSLAILPEIYRDKTNRWRNAHIVLNSFALLIFIGQGFTGSQSLLEVPPNWQEPYVQKLYEQQCNTKNCTIHSTPTPQLSK